MPGGFTWADAFAGYQSAGQVAIDLMFWLFVISMVCGGLWSAAMLWRGREKDRLDRLANRDSVRAEAHEQLARREAVPDWGAGDIYPEESRDAA